MAKDGYKLIYEFLSSRRKNGSSFSLQELADFAGIQIQSLMVYYRNKLKGRLIEEKTPDRFLVLHEIDDFNQEEFIKYISQKGIESEQGKDKSDCLRENSLQALLAAIEIHNKPNFNYRYQIVSILIINSWELLFKSYLIKYRPQVKLFQADGTTKPFNQIMGAVIDTLGKEFFHIRSNLEIIYEYRCNVVHFYSEDINPLLFGLFQKAVENYNNFTIKLFRFKLSDIDDLYILPIGFKRPLSPIDFITNKSDISSSSKELQTLIENIIRKTRELDLCGNQESIIIPFSIHYRNENRLNNADIIAAISGDKDVSIKIEQEIKLTDKDTAKTIHIAEDSIYKEIFTETYTDVVTYCKSHFPNWKQNKEFHSIMSELKSNLDLHRIRYLDPGNQKSAKKDFYSNLIYKTLEDRYLINNTATNGG